MSVRHRTLPVQWIICIGVLDDQGVGGKVDAIFRVDDVGVDYVVLGLSGRVQKGNDVLLSGGETLNDVGRGEGRESDGDYEDGERCDSSEHDRRGQRIMEVGNRVGGNLNRRCVPRRVRLSSHVFPSRIIVLFLSFAFLSDHASGQHTAAKEGPVAAQLFSHSRYRNHL